MRTLAIAFVLSCVALACAALPASATAYYVDAAGGADFTAIKPAVQAAVEGDTIYIAGGTYTGADNRDIEITGMNLQIIGLGGVLIDCEGAGRAFDLLGPGIDSSTLIKLVSITNGVARDNTFDGGGGIQCNEASPIIEYCTIVDCDASRGGAVQLVHSQAVVRYSWFKDNTADFGGAIATWYNAPFFDLMHVWGNVADEGGGAIWCYDGTPGFNRLNIILNADTSRGAAVALDGDSIDATLTKCIVAFSSAGAGISGGTTGTIEHCIVYGNVGGDALPPYAGDNLAEDPLFCDVFAYDPGVCEESPALATENPWGVDIGFCDVDCYSPCQSAAESSSWGRVKALYR